MQRLLIAAGVVAVLAGLVSSPPAPVAAQGKNADWGTIKGRVFWKNPPEREKLEVTGNDKPHCTSRSPDGKTILNQDVLVNPKNDGLANVFVVLLPKEKGGTIPIHPDLKNPKEKQVVVDQPCCMFEPRCIAIREGQEVVVKNSGKVPHNILWSKGNVLIPVGGQTVIKDLKAERLPMMIQCNLHPWMRGRIGVFDHPYFAVTDENGNFEIKLAPKGEYRIMFIHEHGYRGGVKGRDGDPITIKGGQELKLGDLAFR